MTSTLRIIGGEWRSRLIRFEDAPGLRPTPARVRETLFNWLQMDVMGSRCLDLFAGSGALGLEAASRGARRVLQVEFNPQACRQLRQNIAQFQTDKVAVVEADARQFLAHCQESFDLIFLDPPFAQGWIDPLCAQIAAANLLAPYGKIYIECERQLHLTGLPADWQPLKHKIAGEVSYNLYQRSSCNGNS